MVYNCSYDLHASAGDTTPHRRLGGALATGLFGDGAPLKAVVVPESADDLSSDNFAHVDTDKPDDEHSVTTQVVLGELGQYARLALRRIKRAQLLAEVLDVPRPVWTCPGQ